MSNNKEKRQAHIKVLKGLRDLNSYISLLEQALGAAYDSDVVSDSLDEQITKIDDESIDLGKQALMHSIKGLTNAINK